jgi:hypothetical protein
VGASFWGGADSFEDMRGRTAFRSTAET